MDVHPNSRAAYRSISEDGTINRKQKIVLLAYMQGPATCAQMNDRLHWPNNSTSPRIKELRDELMLIQVIGKDYRGRARDVCYYTEKGMDEVKRITGMRPEQMGMKSWMEALPPNERCKVEAE